VATPKTVFVWNDGTCRERRGFPLKLENKHIHSLYKLNIDVQYEKNDRSLTYTQEVEAVDVSILERKIDITLPACAKDDFHVAFRVSISRSSRNS
jgi:hypothetical protein